jgi:hypothetical protein
VGRRGRERTKEERERGREVKEDERESRDLVKERKQKQKKQKEKGRRQDRIKKHDPFPAKHTRANEELARPCREGQQGENEDERGVLHS